MNPIAPRGDEPIAGPSRVVASTSPRRMPLQITEASQPGPDQYEDLLMGLNEDDMNDFDGLDDFDDDDVDQSDSRRSFLQKGESRQYGVHDPVQKLTALSTARCRSIFCLWRSAHGWLHNGKGKGDGPSLRSRPRTSTEDVPRSRAGARNHGHGTTPSYRRTA